MINMKFIINKNTKEVHLHDCWWAKKILPKHLKTVEIQSLHAYLIENRLDACGHCIPELSTNNHAVLEERIDNKNTKQEYNKKEIKVAAYYNWKNRSMPLGDALTDWLKAEEKIKNL